MKDNLIALAGAVLLSGTAVGFEKIALIDTVDFARYCEVERESGTDFIINHVRETGATAYAWRNQTGGIPRYRSAVEKYPLPDPGYSKLRIPRNGVGYGWLKLHRGETDLLEHALRRTSADGALPAVHLTMEESHYYSFTYSSWVLDHPEYGCVMHNGTPWPGHAALSFPEEIEHRIRLLDEILDRGPKLVVLDTVRMCGYGPRFEYTKPSVAKWRATYGCESPKDEKDPRWVKHCGQYLENFVRAVAGRCRARGVRIVLGLCMLGLKTDKLIDEYGLDWPKLCAEGVVDGIDVTYVDWKTGQEGVDIWTATDRVYAKAAAQKGKADVYFPLNAYPPGFKEYAKETGLSHEECARRLLELAAKNGGRGIVMEVVDFGNYPKEVRQAIKAFGEPEKPRAERELTRGYAGVYSPDGRYVAFERDDGDRRRVGVLQLDSGRIAWPDFGPGASYHPSFAPNGDLYCIYANVTNTGHETFTKRPEHGANVFRYRAGRAERVTSGFCFDMTPSVSPDGRTLYFASGRNPDKTANNEIYALDLTAPDAKAKLVVNGATNYSSGVTGPVVSPDGKTLVYGFFGGWTPPYFIASQPVDGSAPMKRLTQGPDFAFAPRFHPSGRFICFASTVANEKWGVWVMNLATGRKARLADGTEPCFSADGTRILYERGGLLYERTITREMAAKYE